MKGEYLPQRTCVCCRKKTDKKELIRLISDNGTIAVDNEKKSSSRGIYICPTCAAAGGKPLCKSLSRAFKRQITESDLTINN